MNISLSPELKQRIREKMDSGAYASENALISEALELLEERERDYQFDVHAVRTAIGQSIEELDAGKGIDGDEFFTDLLNGGKAKSS